MKGILVVRKYKNRRLYDTERSTHITRDELLSLIRSGRTVQVQEAGTGEDVTVEALLQVVQGEEGLPSTVLTSDFLHFLIRADEGALGRFYQEVLPQAMHAFQAMLGGFQAQQRMASTFNPFAGFSSPWGFPFGAQGGANTGPASGPAPAPPEGDDVEDLKRQVEELREEIGRLRKPRARKKKS